MPWPLNHVQAESNTIRPFSPGNAARAGAAPTTRIVAATATASRRSQIANEDFATLARPTNECVPDFDIAPSP